MTEITISIPDFGSMTDDEVSSHPLAWGRDGKWSRQTRWLLSHFGTHRLELNEAWAMTSPVWQCPCCQRYKPEIAKLTDQGVLHCQLDHHHDHLGDLAGEILRAATCHDIPDELVRVRKRACNAALLLIERFAETLICNDCNAADAAMKAALGHRVDRHFSFSPLEIANFILPKPNSSHEPDNARGLEIWTHAQAQFSERLKFAEQLAKRITAGLHDRERLNYTGLDSGYDDAKLLFKLAADQGGPRNHPRGIGDALLARSRSTAGRFSNPKKLSAAPFRIPTAEEFQLLDQTKANSSPWRNSGANWSCAACSRSKFEITRLSKKGKWMALIMELNDFEEETNPISLQRRSFHYDLPLIFGQCKRITVCQDCRQIVTDAKTLVPSVIEDCMPIDAIRKLAQDPKPHQGHVIDRPEIIRVVEANTQWAKAAEDFWIHRDHANDIAFHQLRLVRNTGLSDSAARRQLIPELVAAKKLPGFESDEWFDWLIAESKRSF
ncbi:hypothetical protein [Sphingorhabdus sp. YGSMI21]|uniref:hypothetical protein n=1 Tax=Sphingorhabdus sp. YGSMI21 TaxID=2077182 RepID=UPI000F4EB816|nr:hypothetical protein [Sphingorhabdus sp. YGSMI21]